MFSTPVGNFGFYWTIYQTIVAHYDSTYDRILTRDLDFIGSPEDQLDIEQSAIGAAQDI